MYRMLIAAALALALLGCQPVQRSVSDDNHKAAPASGTDAVTAGAPQSIDVLTDQTMVWECPQCGMDYDRAGTCSMDGSTLVQTRISYICPADNKPVEHSGKCPRCAANARVEKSAMAAAVGGK
jgi:hypothetical protein